MYKIFIEKSYRKGQLWRPKLILEDNIKMDLTETGCGLDSSGSEYIPTAGPCECGKKCSSSIKTGTFLTSQVTINF